MSFTKEELLRYNRQMLIPEFGVEGQTKLKNARVLVVGCGGLGSPILLYLAAAGIGTIGMVENDKVDVSNLQRQILYGTDSVGKNKIEEAEKRLQELNPNCKFESWQSKLQAHNVLEIFKNYDIIIDGTDNFPTRYLINDACVLLHKPLIYGAIYRFEGQVAVFNHKNSINYRDLFPEPPPPEMAPNCAEAGVLGVMAGIIGTMQANEAIKVIAEIGEPLTGKLLMIDALTMAVRILKIPKNPMAKKITQLIDYEAFCGLKKTNEKENIDFAQLKLWQKEGKDFQLIDVREPHEYEIENIGGKLIPLSEIEKNIGQIRKDKTVVVHCQSGLRSQKAIKLLKEKHGFDNLINLTNGLKDKES